jgi:hypothetical protein
MSVSLQVLFYSHGAQGPVGLVSRRSYLGGVQAVQLNATHAAVLTDGRLLLHSIAQQQQQQQGLDSDDAEADLCLPKAGAHHHDPISCAALSQHFVVTGTAAGSLCYHMLQDGELAVVNEYRHSGELCMESITAILYIVETLLSLSMLVGQHLLQPSRGTFTAGLNACMRLLLGCMLAQVAASLRCTRSPPARAWCLLTRACRWGCTAP